MNKNNIVSEDFEREFLKDKVYLIEDQAILDKEFQEILAEENRKPAKLFIINDKKIKTDEPRQFDSVLPF